MASKGAKRTTAKASSSNNTKKATTSEKKSVERPPKAMPLSHKVEKAAATKKAGDVVRRTEASSTPMSKMPTNVTVNSPKRRRLQAEPEKALDLGSNSRHTRHNTRTLKPSEVKYPDRNHIQPQPIAKPKAFYIPLKDQEPPPIPPEEKPKDHTPEHSETTYSDDFESYESDFDSYRDESSSSSADSMGASSPANLGSITKEDKLDSGNYESGESLKPLIKLDGPFETSLADEGFDEGSLGQTTTMSILVAKSEPIPSKRAEELKRLIVLDALNYTLFNMPPISYETFISVYGKTNATQAQCQTNDDDSDFQCQTEEILACDKWTQHPVAFSIYTPNLNNNSKEKSHFHQRNSLQAFMEQKTGSGTPTMITADSEGNDQPKVNFIKLSRFVSTAGSLILKQLKRSSSNEELNPNESVDALSIKTNNIYEYIRKWPAEKVLKGSDDVIFTIHPCNAAGFAPSRTLVCLWNVHKMATEASHLLITSNRIVTCLYEAKVCSLVIAGTAEGDLCSWDVKEDSMWHRTNEKDDFVTIRKCSYHTSGGTFRMHQYGAVVDVGFYRGARGDDEESLRGKGVQVVTLHELGFLTTWTVVNKIGYVHEARKESEYQGPDAYWSKVTLVKNNTVDLNTFHVWRNYLPNKFEEKTIARSEEQQSKITDTPSKGGGFVGIFHEDVEDFEGVFEMETSQIDVTSDEHLKKFILCKGFAYLSSTNSTLIVCNNCKILAIPMSGLKFNAKLHTCEDDGCTIEGITTCPQDAPYFLASCRPAVVHLFSPFHRRPLRDLSYDRINIGDYQTTHLSKWLDTLPTLMTTLVRERSSPYSNQGPLWSKCRPMIFIAHDADAIALWDFVHSDINAKATFKSIAKTEGVIMNAFMLTVAKGDILLLHTNDGRVKTYAVNDDGNFKRSKSENDEMDVLLEYFRLC